MTVATYIVEYLAALGTDAVFVVPGGMIAHLLDALQTQGGPRLINMHHEQAAAFAADAVGRVTGRPGVAFATSGPGAVNLLTGVGSAYFDSVPALFITGQVNRGELRKDKDVRQLGFQETEIVGMAKHVAKFASQAKTPDEVPALLDSAIYAATHGRPGAALLDIPMDILGAAAPSNFQPNEAQRPQATSGPDFEPWLRELETALCTSQRPLVLVGGGLRASRAANGYQISLAELGIPVVNSLMAVDFLPYDHPLRVGLIGTYGNRWANTALAEADLLLVLGSRLDIRQTGADVISFTRGRPVFHVDCEAAEINNRVSGCVGLVAQLEDLLPHLQRLSKMSACGSRQKWKAHIQTLRDQWPDTAESNYGEGINPNLLMNLLSRQSAAATYFVADVGQHQMWAAQSLQLSAHQRFMTSGGMGAMGFALPAAIGATIGTRLRPAVVIAGDGGFQLNIQELQTVVREQLPIKCVVVNNRCLGMIRQFQETYFAGRYVASYWNYSAPDFAAIAQAYGIRAASVSDPKNVEEALSKMWEREREPYLLQVDIRTSANAYPKLAFGRSLAEMEPSAAPISLEGT
jgi:acetolactate synthase-1/2/3 large subunit